MGLILVCAPQIREVHIKCETFKLNGFVVVLQFL